MNKQYRNQEISAFVEGEFRERETGSARCSACILEDEQANQRFSGPDFVQDLMYGEIYDATQLEFEDCIFDGEETSVSLSVKPLEIVLGADGHPVAVEPTIDQFDEAYSAKHIPENNDY